MRLDVMIGGPAVFAAAWKAAIIAKYRSSLGGLQIRRGRKAWSESSCFSGVESRNGHRLVGSAACEESYMHAGPQWRLLTSRGALLKDMRAVRCTYAGYSRSCR